MLLLLRFARDYLQVFISYRALCLFADKHPISCSRINTMFIIYWHVQEQILTLGN